MREKFEAWVMKHVEHTPLKRNKELMLRKYPDGSYHQAWVDSAWLGFQAGLGTADAELVKLREELSGPNGWEANARYVLDRCKHTVRLCEGCGPENLCGSLILTFTKMEVMLAGKAPVPAVAVPYGVDQEAANRIALAVYDYQHGINTEPLLHAINRILIKEVHQLSDGGLAQMRPAVAVPAVPDGCVIVPRKLSPEAWKNLCNADTWPVTPASFQRMLDVLARDAEALLQSTGEKK